MLLCNIRKGDGDFYWGREMTEDKEGLHRDGPLWGIRSETFERLKAHGDIEPMELFPDWYEGVVSVLDVV